MGNYFILIVDDEANIRRTLKRNLRKWAKGKNVILEAADSGRAALDFLKENHEKTAVILSDQKMPELTGSEFLIEAVRLYPQIISVVLTGQASTSDISSFIKAGIFAFLEKPWENETLIKTLNEAFSKYQKNIEDKKRKKIISDELTLASDFNETYMKPVLPGSEVFNFSYSSVSANNLPFSGDYLDIIKLSKGRLLILMGDVTGHGMKASYVIAMLKSIIDSEFFHRIYQRSVLIPSEFISLLNESLCRKLKDFPETFLAFSVCLLHEETGELVYTNAGQPPLMILSESGVSELSLQNIVLGVEPDSFYNQKSYQLNNGDTVFLCTDGLYPSGKEVSRIDKEMLHKLLLRYRDSEDPAERVIENVKDAEKDSFTEDDITVLSVKYLPRDKR